MQIGVYTVVVYYSISQCILQVLHKARGDCCLALHRPQTCNLYKLPLYTLQLCVLDRTHQLQPHCTALDVHTVARLYEVALLAVDERL